MPRDAKKVRRRLQEAALELFRVHSYEQVTGAAIAEHAGVTERTFFRHFADKREVLFDGEQELEAILSEAVLGAPTALGPWAAMLAAFCAAAPLLAANRSLAETRRGVINASPALQERELTKVSWLTGRLAEALASRGTPEPTASLSAHLGMIAFSRAYAEWLENGGAFGEHVTKVSEEMQALLGERRDESTAT